MNIRLFNRALCGALLAAAGLLAGAAPAKALTITQTTNANTLAGTLAGTGVTISNASFSGQASQAGTFTGGANSVGFDSGIVLHTGNVAQIPGPNNSLNGTLESRGQGGTADDDISVDLPGTGSYAPLSALIGGLSTFDAAVLSFDFTFTGEYGGDIYFNFVFASEEYIDWIGTGFNDAFAFFLDDVNIATINGSPISINTVNDVMNSSYYVNNVANTNGIPNAGRNIGFDGLTVVLQASSLGLTTGETHNIKFAVADVGDGILDAGVFIQAQTFSNTPTPTQVPEPASLALAGIGALAFGLQRRAGRA